MTLDIHPGIGLLAACVSVRDMESGTVTSTFCASVHHAVEYGIFALAGEEKKTAVVVVGEEVSNDSASSILTTRSAALCAAIGQAGLFLTLAAQDIVRDRLLDDIGFIDFGVHDAPGADRVERIFAVLHPDLPEAVPPHRRITGNCPRLPRSFVGRHSETDELQDLILQRSLVSIVGPAGVGKTAIGIHVARSFDDEYEDGIWWFSLGDRPSFEALMKAIASTPALSSLRGNFTIDRLVEVLKDKKAILVLDGCEAMLSEVAELASRIASGPANLTLLVTSTKPLGIAGEFVYRLKPMSLPRQDEGGEDALIASEALSLFIERASQIGVRIPLDEPHIQLAGQICRRADGLPVAIEILAASLKATSLDRLATDLAGTAGSAIKRSVDRALRVSFRMLSRKAHALLRRLAMFRGEWKIEMAVRLWSADVDAGAISLLHDQLVDASWIAYDADRDCYHMLQTVQSYLLSEAIGQLASISHEYCARVARIYREETNRLEGPSEIEAEQILRRHYPDAIYALELALGLPEREECAIEIFRCMLGFWLRENLLDDAFRYSQLLMGTYTSGINWGRAVAMIGTVHLRRRNLRLAIEAYTSTLETFRKAGRTSAEAGAIANIGTAYDELEEYDQARYYSSLALSMTGPAELNHLRFRALTNLSSANCREALFTAVDPGKRAELLDSAEANVDQAALYLDFVDSSLAQSVWSNYASIAFARERYDEAESHALRAIAICTRHSIRHEAGDALQILGQINLVRKRAPTAAKLLGLVVQIRKESGKKQTESEEFRFGKILTLLFSQMDQERARKLMRYGEKLELAEILTPTVYNV